MALCKFLIHTLTACALLVGSMSLSGCAAAHLPPDQPMSLLSQAAAKRTQHDNPVTRTMIAGLLKLDDTQKQQFNSLLDTLNRHQLQLKPLVKQFQGQARQAFSSASFSAPALQQNWRAKALSQESRNSGEAAFQIVSFWSSLGPVQRKAFATQLEALQARWNGTAPKSLAELKQKQQHRLREITAGMTLTPAQHGALDSMVLDPATVMAAQGKVRKELEAVLKLLRSPGANVRSLQTALQPLYRNDRYFSTQLTKLQGLHARLKPEQRRQLLTRLK